MPNNIVLDSALYKEWITHSNLAESSVQHHKTGLKRFGEYMALRGFEVDGDLDFNKFYFSIKSQTYRPIDRNFLDEFFAYEVSRGITDSTLRTAVDALKNFFNFLRKIGRIRFDPIRGYPNRFYKPTLKHRRLSIVQVRELLKASYDLTEKTGENYFLLILLLITCGPRATEVCELTFSQIDFERHTILINRGQKTKAKTVYMSTDLEQELQKFFRSKKWDTERALINDKVFSYQGKELSYSRLREMINDVVSSSEELRHEHITAHMFRYTMAALLMDFGVNVHIIQRQMRHERLSTTLHYLGVDAQNSRIYVEQNLTALLPKLPTMLEQLAVISGQLSE